MDFLNISKTVAVLQLRAGTDSRRPLLEQVGTYIRETPYLIMDLRRTPLSSLFLGELVHLHNAARARWGERFPGIHLIGASEQARQLIGLSHLDMIMPMFPHLEAAFQAILGQRARDESIVSA
jgi:anti-anti-sigma regulatory factor